MLNCDFFYEQKKMQWMFLGLSFDWIQKKLYWCESNTGIIGRVSSLNSISEIFVDSEDTIKDVKVDPHNRY